jgi:EmrB/QacA subfamily drug resistance transporter
MAGQVTIGAGPRPAGRRQLILAVISTAQLMVVLDATVVNIALPSAQRALHFSAADRQWIVTAYALAFGSLLLPGGKLADLVGRKRTFIIGLAGFAAASAIGGAATGFPMLVTARSLQGAFGALLAPAGLSLLTTTFPGKRERGAAFGLYGAIVGSGGAVGLLLGGVLTEYLSWRWCLYVNLVFAIVGIAGGLLLLRRERPAGSARLDLAGTFLACSGMFCLVYGCSSAVTRSWAAPGCWGWLVAGAVLLTGFAVWQYRVSSPLIPLPLVRDRNRAGSFLAVFALMAGVSGVFLFLTYYMQDTAGYSPVRAGLAFLPMLACAMGAGMMSNLVLLPRVGPRLLVAAGLLLAAAGMTWLARIGPGSGYVGAILGPLIVSGAGMGFAISPSMNAATFGVPPGEAGVASALANSSQQIGTSVGTAVLNTLAISTVASYLAVATHAGTRPGPALTRLALLHGYTTAFWCAAIIVTAGAIGCAALFTPGPLAAGRRAAPFARETTASPAARA